MTTTATLEDAPARLAGGPAPDRRRRERQRLTRELTPAWTAGDADGGRRRGSARPARGARGARLRTTVALSA